MESLSVQLSLFLLCVICCPRCTTGEVNLENYCFGPPYGSDKSVKHTETIGTETLNFQGFNPKTVETSPNFIVKVYGVKLVTSINEEANVMQTTPLTGWFHLVITLEKPINTKIDRLVINARGYMKKYGWISGVGDFLPAVQTCMDEPEWGADAENIYPSWDKDVEFIPCGGISPFEPTMSGGFVKSYGASSHVGYGKGNIEEFHLNFRISSTPTNFYSKINFRVHGFSGEKLYGLTRSETIVFNTKIIEGAADPVPNPDYPVLCHVTFPDEEIPTVISTSDPAHIAQLSIEDPTADYACLPPENGQSHFTGRCSAGDGSGNPGVIGRRDGRTDRPQMIPEETEYDKAAFEALRTYEDELHEIAGIIDRICSSHPEEDFVCPTLPPRPDTPRPNHTVHTKPELGHHKVNVKLTTEEPFSTTENPLLSANSTSTNTTKSKENMDEIAFGLAFIPGITTFVWDARVIHGIIMTILTFFVFPVDAFTSRYFKETWKNKTIYGHNVWYFLHHFWIGISIILIVGGIGRVVKARNVVGTSLVTEALVHRIIGWVAVGLFAFLIASGGIRCMARGARAVFIAFHFVLGTTLYLICLSEVVTSTFIPGNPAVSAAYRIGSSDFSIPVILVIVRFVIDVIFHIIFSILLCRSDKKAGVTRKRFYLPSPIPVTKDSEKADMPGSKPRTIIFFVYVAISFILTVALCVLLRIVDTHVNNKPLGMGPMSCTHESTTAYKTDDFKGCHDH